MSNNQLPTLREEYLRKKRNKRLLKYGFIFFLFLLILGIFIYIAHLPELNISEVELTGGVLVTKEDITKSSLEYMQGSYLWIFPVRNSLIYPKGQLKTYLKETYKRIDTIEISRKDFHTLQVDITERKPVATWCREISETEEKCYFLDQNSTVFAEAPNFSGDAYFKYYGLIENENPIGSFYIASSSQFSEISHFVEFTKKIFLKPQYLIAKSDGDFSLVLSGGTELYFDTKKSLSTVAENLEAILKTPALATSSLNNLPAQYIDLRYGNKLFYKLKTQ